MATPEETRKARLEALAAEFETYVEREEQKIANEVASLEAILRGRAGGEVQERVVRYVEAVAYGDLADFLNPS